MSLLKNIKNVLKSLNIPFNDPCDPDYTGSCICSGSTNVCTELVNCGLTSLGDIPNIPIGQTEPLCLKYNPLTTTFYWEDCCLGCTPAVPTVMAEDNDFDTMGMGTVGTPYSTVDLTTLVTSNTECEPSVITIGTVVNATYTGTLPNIDITPTDTPWSIEYSATCSDGSTLDTGILSGTTVPVVNTCDWVLDYTTTPGFLILNDVLWQGATANNWTVDINDINGNMLYTGVTSTTPLPTTSGYPVPSTVCVVITSADSGDTSVPCNNCIMVEPGAVGCGDTLDYNYSGVGGLSASIVSDFEVLSDTDFNLHYTTFNQGDLVEILYDGVVLYANSAEGALTTNSLGTSIVIPIVHSGTNYLQIRVTNPNPSINTAYSITASCCTAKACSDYLATPVVTASVGSCVESISLLGVFDITGCAEYKNPITSRLVTINYSGLGFTVPSIDCRNTTGTVTKVGNDYIYTFANAADAAALKAEIDNIQAGSAVTLNLDVNTTLCGDVSLAKNLFFNFSDFTITLVGNVLTISANATSVNTPDQCAGAEGQLFEIWEDAVAADDFAPIDFLSLDGSPSVADVIVNQLPLQFLMNHDFPSTSSCTNIVRSFEIGGDNNDLENTWIVREDTTGDGVYDTVIDQA